MAGLFLFFRRFLTQNRTWDVHVLFYLGFNSTFAVISPTLTSHLHYNTRPVAVSIFPLTRIHGHRS